MRFERVIAILIGACVAALIASNLLWRLFDSPAGLELHLLTAVTIVCAVVAVPLTLAAAVSIACAYGGDCL